MAEKEPPQVPRRTMVHHVQPQKPSLRRNGLQRAYFCFHIVASSNKPQESTISYSVTRKFSLVNSLSRLAIFVCFLYNVFRSSPSHEVALVPIRV